MLLSKLSRIISLIAFLCWGGFGAIMPSHSAEVDPQRPTESLYRIYAEASQTGWTTLHHIQAGNMAYQMGDHLRAVAHWQSVDLQDPIILQRLSQILLDLNRWDDVIVVLRQWLMISPYEDYANHHLGLLLAGRDPIQALGHLLTTAPQTLEDARTVTLIDALEQSPKDPALPIIIGQILFEQGRFGYAEYAFKHGAMWNVDSAFTSAYIALSRQAQGKDGSAWMRIALEHGIKDAQIHYLYGFYLRNEGRYSESVDAFARAVALDMDNPLYYAELGEAYQYAGDMTVARHWLEYAVTLSNYHHAYVERLNQFNLEEQTLLGEIGQQ
jgi:tetratricopeptide (TPR) repeat protein